MSGISQTDLTNLPSKRQPRRTEMELTHDRAILANIKLKNPGATSAELSDLFYNRTGRRMAPRTIRDDLKIIQKTWLSEMVEDYNQLRAKELAKLDVVEQEAWDAWNQSKSDFIREVVEKARKKSRPPTANVAGDVVGQIVAALAEQETYLHDEVVEAIIHDSIQEAINQSVDEGEDEETFINKIIQTTESRVGDVRFLRAIHEMQQERRKILGVYAPELHQMDIRKFEVKGYIGWTPDNWNEKDADVVDGEILQEKGEDA